MMFISSVLAVALAAVPAVFAQDYSAAHNVTPISGTWSSGSKKVITGAVSTLLVPHIGGLLTAIRALPIRRT